jgi:DNA-binding transcriptional LysR family regulator
MKLGSIDKSYMLNLHHLSIFHAVAQTRSISRGAERLLISQPAVSKQLRIMEHTIKCKLFDRNPKGVDLTPAGRVLVDYASRVFALADEAERAMNDLSSFQRGSLSVGAGPTVGVYLLPRAMVQFRRHFPAIHLHAETEGPDVLRQRLLDGVIEFAVSEAPVISSELSSKTLMHDVLVPVVAGQHALVGRRAITAGDFCRQPFIARQVDSASGSLVERTLLSRGLQVNTVLTVASTEAIKQAVIAGLGVAMVSRLAIQTEIAAGLLAELKIKGLAIRYPIHHLWRRGRSQSKLAAEFLGMLARPLEDL